MRMLQCGEIRTSVLGFGCGSVMGRVGRTGSLRALHAAWDAGITLFDTARSYGYGEAEGLLGEFLVGRREQATVVTKFGILPTTPARWKRAAKPAVRALLSALPAVRPLLQRGLKAQSSGEHFTPAMLRHSLEESLRQLRTDYVDVLLAHEAPASVMAQHDLMAELEAVVREGKARRAGLSCSMETAAGVLSCAPPLVQAVQFPVNLLDAAIRTPAANASLFTMANHPFGGAAGVQSTQKALRAMSADRSIAAPLRAKIHEAGSGLIAEVALQHALLHAHSVVPSMLRLDHLQANVNAVRNPRFNAADMEAIRGYRQSSETMRSILHKPEES